GSHWFWNGAREVMSAKECVVKLISAVGGDGNLLMDFGPRDDGRIDPKFEHNYRAMGRYLKKYGESIYETRGGPYKPGVWGVSTRKDNKVYLHITQMWPSGILKLPVLSKKVVKCSTLTGGKPKVTQDKDGLTVSLPAKYHDDIDTIIVLELDGPAMDIKPIDPVIDEHMSLTMDCMVTASSMISDKRKDPRAVVLHGFETGDFTLYYGEVGQKGIAETKKKEVNEELIKQIKTKRQYANNHRGHVWRYWMAADEDKEPWLEVDLGKAVTFNHITMEERCSRIRKFDLQYYNGKEWKVFYKGSQLGVFSFNLEKPIKALKVRIRMLKFEGGAPSLKKFDLYMR
ncbi:alpha-L-fucosidase, partial [Verrucomicrobiota bacterium]